MIHAKVRKTKNGFVGYIKTEAAKGRFYTSSSKVTRLTEAVAMEDARTMVKEALDAYHAWKDGIK